MSNKHGVFVREEATALTVPQESSAGLQVVIGTAPVNVLDDPASAVNVPILADSCQFCPGGDGGAGVQQRFQELHAVPDDVCDIEPLSGIPGGLYQRPGPGEA